MTIKTIDTDNITFEMQKALLDNNAHYIQKIKDILEAAPSVTATQNVCSTDDLAVNGVD